MRTYSRARTLADQLAAERRPARVAHSGAALSGVADSGGAGPAPGRGTIGLQGRLLAEARVPRRSALETNVSSGFEQLRQHLGGQPAAEHDAPGAAPSQNQSQDLYQDPLESIEFDDALEVPRFVANAGEAQANADDDELPPYVTYERPVRLAPERHHGPRWPAVLAMLAIVIPAASGVTILAFAGEEKALKSNLVQIAINVDAAVTAQLGLEAGSLLPPLPSDAGAEPGADDASPEALTVVEAEPTPAPLIPGAVEAHETSEIATLVARANNAMRRASGEAGAEEDPAVTIANSIAYAPGMTALHMATLDGAAEPKAPVNIASATPSAVPAHAPDQEDYTEADADTLPAMTHAVRGAVAGAPLDAVTIAWASPDEDMPMAQPVPRLADLEPVAPFPLPAPSKADAAVALAPAGPAAPAPARVLSVARVGDPPVAAPLGTRSAFGGAGLPVPPAGESSEPLVSQIVGSLTSTSAPTSPVAGRANPSAPAAAPKPLRVAPRVRPKLRQVRTVALTPGIVATPKVEERKTVRTRLVARAGPATVAPAPVKPKAAAKLRPRPKPRTVDKAPSVEPRPAKPTIIRAIERNAVVAPKRPKPRPLPELGSGFLAKQTAAKLARRAAADKPKPVAFRPAGDKPKPAKPAVFRPAAAKPAPVLAAKPKVQAPQPSTVSNAAGIVAKAAAKTRVKLPPPSWSQNLLTR